MNRNLTSCAVKGLLKPPRERLLLFVFPALESLNPECLFLVLGSLLGHQPKFASDFSRFFKFSTIFLSLVLLSVSKRKKRFS